LRDAGINYGGSLANHDAPLVFAQHKVTVHVPRRPYTKMLNGIPTIRVFEALACGIPLVSAPWQDSERLFTPGKDFLMVSNGEEMTDSLQFLVGSKEVRSELVEHGLETILSRHTCAHRVDELLTIVAKLNEESLAAGGVR
jgi:spore maturation protein CgeB